MITPRPSLTLFAHLVSMPDSEIDLAEAALVFADSEYPGLEIPYYMAVLDDLGREARHRIDRRGDETTEGRARVLIELLYQSLGFHGNTESYYDPRNSYLNEVLDRRSGIPISLALVFLEVAARARVEASGISFPGHFLIRAGAPERPFILDPFHGRILGPAELSALAARVTKENTTVDPKKLEPCTKRQLLFRMLTNLRNIYASRGDEARLRCVLEHLIAISPQAELRRELDKLGGTNAFVPNRAAGRQLN